MAANKEVIVNTEGSKLTLSREFDAPRDLVFKAYSDCKHLSRWWAPAGWSLTQCEMDFQAGGRWHYCMSSDTEDMQVWVLARYEKIAAPEHIQYADHFADEDANPNPDMPAAQVVVAFSEDDGVTKLVSRTTYASEEHLQQILEMGQVDGVTETWAKLEDLLAEMQS